MNESPRRGIAAHGWSRRALIGAALTAPLAMRAHAQTYPSRNPRLIVPFATGGPADTLARVAAEQVSTRLGQQVIVDSRPGAGGNLAGETVARAEADGYTLLVAGQSILAKFFPDGVSAWRLFLGALIPTLVVCAAFLLFR